MGGILILVLSLSMPATQDRPVAAVEQYKAILKESGRPGKRIGRLRLMRSENGPPRAWNHSR